VPSAYDVFTFDGREIKFSLFLEISRTLILQLYIQTDALTDWLLHSAFRGRAGICCKSAGLTHASRSSSWSVRQSQLVEIAGCLENGNAVAARSENHFPASGLLLETYLRRRRWNDP